jgi:hypothetical protein
MADPTSTEPTSPDKLAWALIALGTLAIAFALWDVLIEQDGSAGESLTAGAIGVLVIGLGIQRYRR